MKQELSLQRRRLMLVSLGFLFLATFLGLRLIQKSLIQHGTYQALAKGQQYQQTELVGKRGQILVKDGPGTSTYPLATNQTLYAVNLVPSQIADKRKTADELAKLTQADAQYIYDQINNNKQYVPPLKQKLSYDEAQKVKDLKLEGVYIRPQPTRFYPEDGLASQVLGFVNGEGAGQYGIEGHYDDMLAGSSGQVGTAKNATGEALALGASSYTPPKDGDTMVLTVDRNVQYQAEQALSKAVDKFHASGGSVIIMNPQTGGIVALASRPTFDPNRYSAYDVGSYTNQTESLSYEPGSTFKVIAMGAALDAGAVTPTTTVNGTASVKVGDREIFNSAKKPYGLETMTQVIENSDNVGMVFVSRQIGGQKLYDYIKKFGFGTPTGVELAGEISPTLPALSGLNEVNFATMAFGQGISVTPLQLITAVNAYANQGKLIQPHIVDQIQHQDGKVENVETKAVRQVVSPQAASQITGMMVRVVEAGAGKPAAVAGYRVAGKTGTAQIPQGGAYEENATIGNFVGFAPADNPRFIMLVKVDRPKGVTFAEESAAPTFGELAKFLLTYYNVPPSK
ncbi:penicillin-binding protein 2 [Patescibacteria group bacterium]|nr:penicillin-binding protein 2 [Patescibacteria group bacterium]